MKQTIKDLLHHNRGTTTGTPLTGTTGTTPLTGTTSATPLTGPLPTTSTSTVAPGSVPCVPVGTVPGASQVIERPAVVHERIRREEVEEIQPVIHREHERVEVHQITQPLYEGQIQPPQIVTGQLPSEVRETVTRGVYVPPALPKGTREFEGVHRVAIEKPPIIMETEKKRIIEEVQPVLYKEVVQPAIIQETRPIYEKIIEAPTIVRETRQPVHCHGVGVGQAPSFGTPLTSNIPPAPPAPPVQPVTTGNIMSKQPVLEKTVSVQQQQSHIPRT